MRLLFLCLVALCLTAFGSAQTHVFNATQGVASWYGPNFVGRPTANGETFDPNQLTAAHKTLPFDTMVKVTNLNNGMSVVVRINDRGPFVGNRIIDLSRASAHAINMIGSGTAPVQIEPLQASGRPVYLASSENQLASYEMLSRHHKAGELILVRSSQTNQSVVVRVIGGEISPQVQVDVALSPYLYDLLGSSLWLEGQ